MRDLIVPGLIEKDESLVDDDRYFITKSDNKDEIKYKYNLSISFE